MSLRSRWAGRDLLVAFLLAAGTFGVFSRSLSYGFVDYDDFNYLLNNPHVQGGFTWENLKWAFAGEDYVWNPLVRITHILDGALFDLSGWGDHLQNLLWHSLNAALAYFVVKRLTGARGLSAFSAALFAWHPLRVESVTWISERKDVVSVAFGLWSVLAYLSYAERKRTGEVGAGRAYVVVLIAYLGALLSKPSMVTLPGLFLLLDAWPGGRFADGAGTAALVKRTGGLLREKLPFAVLAGVFSWVSIHTQTTNGAVRLELSFWMRAANAVVSVPRYLGKFFWPVDLCALYPHPGWWPWWSVAGALLFVGAISLVASRVRRNAPWVAVGWGWFLVMVLPSIGLIQVGFQSMADRYTYFPSLGWQVALLVTLWPWVKKWVPQQVAAGLGVLLLAVLAARTWDQQRHWESTLAIYEHAVNVTEENAQARQFLGMTYVDMGRFAEARREYDAALKIEPTRFDALVVRAELNATEGRSADTLADYRSALALKPESLDTWCALADQYFALGRTADAKAIYDDVLRKKPNYPGAQIGRASIEWASGHQENAIAILQQTLEREPESLDLLVRLVVFLHQLGRDEDAAGLFAGAIRRGPVTPGLLRDFADCLASLGRFDEAIEQMTQAVAKAPRQPQLHKELGELFLRAGRLDDALSEFDKALKIQPRFAQAAFGAAQIHLQRGETSKAIERLRQTVEANVAMTPAYELLAQISFGSGNAAETDAWLQKAIEHDPKNPTPVILLADSLTRQRKIGDAVALYRKAIELDPNSARARVGLGYGLLSSGDRVGARVEWQRALDLDPTFPQLRENLQRLREEP